MWDGGGADAEHGARVEHHGAEERGRGLLWARKVAQGRRHPAGRVALVKHEPPPLPPCDWPEEALPRPQPPAARLLGEPPCRRRLGLDLGPHRLDRLCPRLPVAARRDAEDEVVPHLAPLPCEAEGEALPLRHAREGGRHGEGLAREAGHRHLASHAREPHRALLQRKPVWRGLESQRRAVQHRPKAARSGSRQRLAAPRADRVHPAGALGACSSVIAACVLAESRHRELVRRLLARPERRDDVLAVQPRAVHLEHNVSEPQGPVAHRLPASVDRCHRVRLGEGDAAAALGEADEPRCRRRLGVDSVPELHGEDGDRGPLFEGAGE
mmetsp:Transcript_33176/g.105805  ORF Transcript_33176/g.105805 Transcript_33176/m.105805 type:complete len:326 (-) Transcript_33176:744-1721(-)